MCSFYRMYAVKKIGSPRRFAVVLCLFLGSLSQAGVDVCEDPGDYSFASIDFARHANSSIKGMPAETNQENRNFDVTVAAESKKFLFGIGHRYMIFDFNGIEPQTNAHLHTSFVPLHWRFPDSRREIRVSVAPALSGSSNVMGHPREYEGDTLQFLMALVAETRMSDQLSVSYGICGDHRFGEYEIYPVAGIEWQPRPDWELALGFPSSHLRYDVTERIVSTLKIAPDGNEWHVMDRDFEAESRLVYESIALEWVTSWQIQPRFTVTVSLGRQLRNRYELTLQTGERVHLTSEPANRFGAGLRWRF